jgi:copper transport protein
MMKRLVVVSIAAVGILSAAPQALAHARLIQSEPADGAVLRRAPRAIVLVFDQYVQPLRGIQVIRNDGGSIERGRIRTNGRNVFVPLQSDISRGEYTVLWRIVSDDGHTIAGVFAFAVGPHQARPRAALAAPSAAPQADNVIGRWLFLVGLLVAAGTAAFVGLVWRPALARTGEAEPNERSPFVLMLAAFTLSVAGAALSTPFTVAPATRFALLYEIGALLAVLGIPLAGLAVFAPRAWLLPSAVAIALLPVPTLAGHALDPGHARGLNAVADVLHVGAAAVWLGGTASLALALSRLAARVPPDRRVAAVAQLAGRFSGLALVSVLVLVGTGVIRALSEIAGIGQLWTSGYGRALLIKSGLLAILLGLGWFNRYRFVPHLRSTNVTSSWGANALSKLRRSVSTEAFVLLGVVAAVAFLIDLPPGRELTALASAQPKQSPVHPRPITPPPLGAVVLAREDGDLAVGLAVSRRSLEVTVLGPLGYGVDGLRLHFRIRLDGRWRSAEARVCGSGCYSAHGISAEQTRALAVVLSDGRGTSVVPFSLPPFPAPAGAELVRRAARKYRHLRSLRIQDRLTSDGRHVVLSTWKIVAPDRFAYTIQGPRGSSATVIGMRRWDRSRGGRWQFSEASRIPEPTPFWGEEPVTNAHVIGSAWINHRAAWVVSFFVPGFPGWFTASIEKRTHSMVDLRMVATAHFMHERYMGFNQPIKIAPPRARRSSVS